MFAGIRIAVINILIAMTTPETIQTTAGVIVDTIFTNPVRRAGTAWAFVYVNGTVFARVTSQARTRITVYTILRREDD